MNASPHPKLLAIVTAHVTTDEKRQIETVAHLAGCSPSAYLRGLITEHLAEKRAELTVLQSVFRSEGTDRTDGTR